MGVRDESDRVKDGGAGCEDQQVGVGYLRNVQTLS